MCQLLTGSSLWCWGSPRNESGVSQLDRTQLDPEGTGFRVAPLNRTASAAEERRRTYLDHWALFTSGLPLQASQTHAGPFLLRLNRSPPPPHPVLQRGPGQAAWVLHIYTPFLPAASGCLMLLIISWLQPSFPQGKGSGHNGLEKRLRVRSQGRRACRLQTF